MASPGTPEQEAYRAGIGSVGMRRRQNQTTKLLLVQPEHQFPPQHDTLAGDDLDASHAFGMCGAQEAGQRAMGALSGVAVKV
jgi:hypothetical protein